MSKEQQAQAQPQVAIPLPKAKKNLVQIGCICMMLSVAMYGLVFATLTAPILEKVDAMGYVGLFSIVGAIGVSIMTPMAAPCQIMIMEPGGYKLKDYLKCGTPLAIIIAIVSIFMLPMMFPF